MSDRENLKQFQIGQVSGLKSTEIADAPTTIKATHRRTFTWRKTAADTNAGDNTAEFQFAELERAGRVVSVKYSADANTAAHNTNTITLTVSKRLAADPANAVVVANGITTVAGLNSFVAWTPKAITLVANAVTYTANSVLTFAITKANSGVALAAGVLSVDVEEGD